MRLPVLLSACWLLGLSTAWAAAPPGYRPPRRFYNARHQAYYRPGGRLTFSSNLAYYNGDLTSKFSDNTFHPGYGVGFTQVLSPHVTLAGELSLVRLQAKDYLPSRGYSFDSDNGLLAATVRYNLFEDKSLFVGLNMEPTPANLFVEAGLGAILVNPTAYQADGLGGRRQLPPETHNSYPSLAGVLPVGIGGTLRATPNLYFTLDALYYFTTTDLLDDISQRGNPKQPDNFATLTLKVEFGFGKGRRHPLTHNN